MRLLRVIMVAASFAALLAKPSAAQDDRPFHDAWFMGVRGGLLNYSTESDAAGPANGTANSIAPLVGLDWVITRSRAGLYVGFDQSFFSSSAYYRRPAVAGDPTANLRNLRRISLAAMLFPMQRPMTHPYMGFGLALNQIGSAELTSAIAIPALASAARDSLQSKRVAISPMIIAGIQQRLPGFSVFAQGSGSWLQNGFLLKNLNSRNYLQWTLEGGIRYNIGSSIDREP